MLIEKITQYLVSKEQPHSQSVYYMSNAGECARKLAYKRFPENFVPEPIQPRGILTMWYGKIVEGLLMRILRMTGSIHGRQKRLELEIDPEVKLTGRIDGLTEFEGKDYIVEVKSITTHKFWEIQKGELGYNYKCQAECYMRALDLNCKFLFFDRNDAELAEIYVTPDDTLWEAIKARFKRVFNSTAKELPLREYEPVNDKLGPKLGYPCSYCQYKAYCYPDYVRGFEKGRAVYRLKEVSK